MLVSPLGQDVEIHHHNEAITNLALPDRRLPVLVPATSRENTHGTVSFHPWNVRRIGEDALKLLFEPGEHPASEIEKKYGALPQSDRDRLLRILALVERLARGDWSPIIEKEPVKVERSPEEGKLVTKRILLRGVVTAAPFALLQKINQGLERVRFVVWLAECEQKFAPGLYCDDLGSAVCALLLSNLGERGGLGACEFCGKTFFRSRRSQRYCGYKCQTAAGMRRYRAKAKRKAKRQNSKRR
jgi:hypothetical protein